VEIMWKPVVRRKLILLGGSRVEIGVPAKRMTNIPGVQPVLDAYRRSNSHLHRVHLACLPILKEESATHWEALFY
jgi:hypothetical protein